MKVDKITNAQEFFKVVDSCVGRVELLKRQICRNFISTLWNMKNKIVLTDIVRNDTIVNGTN